MDSFWSKVIPIIIIFFLGYFLKKIKLFCSNTADTLLKIVFYVTLPALTFLSGSTAELSLKFFYLPIIAIAVVLIIFSVSFPISKKFNLPKATQGTFIVGTLLMNTGFTLPFVLAAYGNQGLAIYTIFDFGNTLMIFTFAYYFAIKFGKNEHRKIPIKKFLLLPPIWGLFFGIIFNLLKFELHPTALNFMEIVGKPTIFLVILSLGIYFSPKITNLGKMLTVFSIRIGLGMSLGLLAVNLLNIEGIMRTLIVVFCGAPVGYNTLVFASLEEMDKEFAASLVSISLLLGIIYVPLLIYFLWFQIDVEKKPLSKPKAYKSPLSKGRFIIEKKSFPLYLSSNPRIRLWILSVQLHYSQVVSVLSQYIFSELPLIASQVKTTVKRAMRINCIEMKSLFLWFVSFGDTKEMNIEYIPLLAIFFYAISF